MDYEEAVRAEAFWEKVRYAALVVGILFAVLSAATKTKVYWVAGGSWMLGGVATFRQARVLKKLGRDPDAMYLYAAVVFGCGVWFLF